MATKGATARAAARKQKDKWKSKRWYTIRAPRTPWDFQVIGETLGETPEHLIGRIYELTQHEADGNFSRMHVKLRFRVVEVVANDAITEFIGLEMMNDHVRRQVRRYRGKVDDVVKVGDKLRVEIADIDNRGKISLILVDEDADTEKADSPADAPVDAATASN